MKNLRAVLFGAVTCLSFIGVAQIAVAHAASIMKSVTLPAAEGDVVGAAFSPDSSRLAVIRHVVPGTSGQGRIMHIVQLKSGQEISHAEVLNGVAADVASSAHFIRYSSGGR